MSTLTNREVFDRVSEHLLSQGQACINDRACLYRGTGGLKCAVGCLIADEHYGLELEGHGVDTGYVCNALRASGVPVDQSGCLDMLCELQDMHDMVDPERWASYLESVRAKWFPESQEAAR